MKFFYLFLFITIVSYSSAFAAVKNSVVPHLELEMNSLEYEQALAKRAFVFSDFSTADAEERLEKVLAIGKRNLDWLKFMNEKRAEGNKFSFSSAATQNAYPIESPGESNEEIVLKKYDALLAELPKEMLDILLEKKDFTSEPPVDEALYLDWGRKVDRVYQGASRWILQLPYLSAYAARKSMDVRGYYYLQREENLEQKLKDFSKLPSQEQQKIKTWLLGMCLNGESLSEEECAAAFTNAYRFYQKYLPDAQEMFGSFFTIPVYRRDVIWNAKNSNQMLLPFENPNNNAVQYFLQKNIEEEWRWQDWSLQLVFQKANPMDRHTRVEFVPGSTPHVNGLAGSIITMDANAPLTEYDVQWTIRHEFGHVLGFPDCYVEFYEEDRGVMVNYQIDTSNVMCSRRGHLQQKHYDELKRVYYK